MILTDGLLTARVPEVRTKYLQKVDIMRLLDMAAGTLVVVGALNWGLVAVARFDLVAWICGGMSFGDTNVASRIVYGLVGLAGVYAIASIASRRQAAGPAAIGAR
jgi:uncharacterized membrane protein YuzA (DUF378 family)